MKKLLLTVATLLAVTSTAQADTEKCTFISESAELIMQLRQSNAPIADVLKITEDFEILLELVIKAYEAPRYNSEEYKADAVTDFSNLTMVTCLQSLKEVTTG